jgi:phospholipase C
MPVMHASTRVRPWVLRATLLLTLALSSAFLAGLDSPAPVRAATSPIQHVVIIYQENHSFDNVLGYLCVEDNRCDGVTSGKRHDGSTISLSHATDVVPGVAHNTSAQNTAINRGAMNGFDLIAGCKAGSNYQCYTQYRPARAGATPTDIPNLARLARRFALSDRTFSLNPVPSWGAHLELAAATLDGFVGDNPQPASGVTASNGWGCDSNKVALWHALPTDPLQSVPSCVPKRDGSGPFRPSPVSWVPTIMDRLGAAGKTWRLYTGSNATNLGYGWAICPTFADCLYTSQKNNMVASSQFQTDATAGRLPNLALVMPLTKNSQHNKFSMQVGDNYIGSLVNALMNGPQWSSTAIFITYDDCGCFYDHVAPPPRFGIRMPMVIVSPYAISGHTDSNVASFASMLAYVEHTFGIAALGSADQNAYDYNQSFNYGQAPLAPVPMVSRPISPAAQRWLDQHPADDDDPT